VRDLALDAWPAGFIAFLPGRVTLLLPGFLQDLLVRVDGDGAAAGRGGARRPQRAGAAPGPERGPAAARCRGDDGTEATIRAGTVGCPFGDPEYRSAK
jgi:hypothetical protein